MAGSDPGPIGPGRQFGSYLVESLLGAGGMGEVYRARDTKLGRDVALKVLSAPFAGDPDRLSRFEREALLLAALNHPNIGIIYGLEEAGGMRALVLELIEGPTLAERIAQGPIPLDAALALARQIVDALQSAHDNGVIHRDLKPANIKVRRDGTVKVLDFGLAKLTGELSGTGGPRFSNSPTMVASMPGLLLGTAGYMSPEQAKGQEADRRSDVWAFGCVLFEMLTGRQVFAGDSSTEVFASVLKTEPDWSRLPAGTPDAIRRLLRRCLEKDDRRRVWDIADARLEIDEARAESIVPGSATPPRLRAERLAWGSVVAVLAVLAVTLGLRTSRAVPAPSEVQFDVNTPTVSDPEDLLSVSVSPDGKTLVFVANSEGQPYLWVRPLDSVTAHPLPGTMGASLPFWSPDSRSVAFYADGQLKRLDLDGGLVRTLTQATRGVGGTWNRDDIILFSPNPASAIFRIPADGGTPVRVTTLDAKHAGHGMPSFLPDGRHFLYIASGTPDSRGVYVGQLDESPPRKLTDADTAAMYAVGHLLFIRQTQLFAQSFDAERRELRGSPFPVMAGVTDGTQGGALAASVGGTLAVRVGRTHAEQQLTWLDRSGTELETLGDLNSASRTGFSPAPDGGHLAYFRRGETNSDIWMLETRRNLTSRFTTHSGEDIFPVWSRDGNRIVFSSNRNGGFALYQKPTAGNDAEALVLAASPEETFASDTSPDGRVLLYQKRSTKTGWDIWALPLRAGGEPTPVVQTEFDERDGLLSPDGKWLAYFANNSGRFEVYVQPFPEPGGMRQQVSTNGGVQMRWGPDGRELFYIALDSKLMAVPMNVAADGRSVTVGTPAPLFAVTVGRLINPGPSAVYVVSADGKRFLMNRLVLDAAVTPIRVIVNWKGRP